MVKNEKMPYRNSSCYLSFPKRKKQNKTKEKQKLFSIITKLTQDFFLKCAIFLRYKKDLADPV